MIKFLTSIGLTLMLSVSVGWSYTWSQFWEDLVTDTQEKFAKDLKTGYYKDFLASGDNQNRFGVSSTVLAYKFISVDPAWIYTPSSANRVGALGISFPIHPTKIPIGSQTVGEILQDEFGELEKWDSERWLSRFYVGPYFAVDAFNLFQEDKLFQFGVNAGVKF